MDIGIIGCGLIGQKRAQALSGHRLAAVADISLARAQALQERYPQAIATDDWREVLQLKNVDAVIVATTNNWLAPITLAAVQAGKHVLVEKPAACRLSELTAISAAAEQQGVCVQVGFNHRYHPACLKAYELFQSGLLGPLMFIRARYGHGGRLGYEQEWRANPEIAGGGELIDQGVHLIDLARLFLGDFVEVSGEVATYYWDMPVEDNAFLCLQTKQKQIAWLQASCTEWKNLFSFEIYGRNAKLHIEGLGGSYGVERLSYYQMLPQMGPPDTTIWEYPGADLSWQREFADFIRALEQRATPWANLSDAQAALKIVEQIYQGSHQ